MLETVAVALAVKAVDFVAKKALEGAVQEAGGDAYRAATKKLRKFIDYRFSDNTELENIASQKSAFVEVVKKELLSDESFEKELSKLVADVEKNSDNSTPSQVNQGDGSIANIGSNLENVDQSDNSIKTNVSVGGNNTGSIDASVGDRTFFRR
jgi:hypothetical protein